MTRPSANVAFCRMYDKYFADVLAYCLRRASIEDAKDAVADVFLVAWRRFDDMPDGDRALPWLYGTARRVLANQRRSRSRFARLTDRLRSMAPEPEHEPTPETIVVRNQRNQEVLDALERLRPNDREVVRLVMWEGLPHAAVGDVLGCSDRAVSMRLHRALGRLRSELHATAQGSTDVSSRTEVSDE